MITSSITAQCYPLRIIHNAIYTLNEIYSPLYVTHRLRYIFENFFLSGDFPKRKANQLASSFFVCEFSEMSRAITRINALE